MRSLFRKADRPRRAAATPVAHAVVRQDAVTVGKRRLVQERPEPFDAGAVVYEHDRLRLRVRRTRARCPQELPDPSDRIRRGHAMLTRVVRDGISGHKRPRGGLRCGRTRSLRQIGSHPEIRLVVDDRGRQPQRSDSPQRR
jgi:hypothetical protein